MVMFLINQTRIQEVWYQYYPKKTYHLWCRMCISLPKADL